VVVHDFSDIECLWVEYAVRTPEGEKKTIRLDADHVLIELQTVLPTLFKPTGEKDEDGNPILGANRIMECFISGDPLPDDLPPLLNIIASMRRIMRVPEYCTDRIVLLVTAAVAQDMASRAELKKDLPGSLGSLAPTPDASDLKTSAPTNEPGLSSTSPPLKPGRISEESLPTAQPLGERVPETT
jgi:hypothetical protein